MAVILHRGNLRRNSAISVVGDATLLQLSSSLPGKRQHLLIQSLDLAALTFLLLALARPQSLAPRATVKTPARDIVFMLDLSRSMNAQDVGPSRLVAAKNAAITIARSFPGDRVGLVVFGGSAFLQLPPTVDHSAFEQFIEAASTKDIPDPSTNIEAAMAIVATLFERGASSGGRAAVLLSDGENMKGDSDGFAARINRLAQDSVRVFAIGIGTAAGAEIPERGSTGALTVHRDTSGTAVVSRLMEPLLQEASEETGGHYIHWEGTASVRPLITDLSLVDRHQEVSRTSQTATDRFQRPLALALLVLALEMFAAVYRRRSYA
ncbi:MAG: VWA domain-containing protein [Gemmatimonadaceae bacterium]